jgi:hypothetical protein
VSENPRQRGGRLVRGVRAPGHRARPCRRHGTERFNPALPRDGRDFGPRAASLPLRVHRAATLTSVVAHARELAMALPDRARAPNALLETEGATATLAVERTVEFVSRWGSSPSRSGQTVGPSECGSGHPPRWASAAALPHPHRGASAPTTVTVAPAADEQRDSRSTVSLPSNAEVCNASGGATTAIAG